MVSGVLNEPPISEEAEIAIIAKNIISSPFIVNS